MNILIIVEGEKTEPDFFNRYCSVFGIAAKLFIVGTNLYSLYDKMKNYDFACDIKDVLEELDSSGKYKTILDEKFAFTYLIFDSDIQNKPPNRRDDACLSRELISENFSKLEEMSRYFTDETDPTIGKLYINYPMMESFRYCNSFDDSDYSKSYISIDHIKEFKLLSSKKKLSGKPIESYTKSDFSKLIYLNIKKLFLTLDKQNDCSLSYIEYTEAAVQSNIVDGQKKLIETSNKISTIHCRNNI